MNPAINQVFLNPVLTLYLDKLQIVHQPLKNPPCWDSFPYKSHHSRIYVPSPSLQVGIWGMYAYTAFSNKSIDISSAAFPIPSGKLT